MAAVIAAIVLLRMLLAILGVASAWKKAPRGSWLNRRMAVAHIFTTLGLLLMIESNILKLDGVKVGGHDLSGVNLGVYGLVGVGLLVLGIIGTITTDNKQKRSLPKA